MSKTPTTYEIVGDYLKSTRGPYVLVTNIKHASIGVEGPIENASTIHVGSTTIRNTRYETGALEPSQDSNIFIPDMKGFIQNAYRASGIQSVSGASRSRKTRRRL